MFAHIRDKGKLLYDSQSVLFFFEVIGFFNYESERIHFLEWEIYLKGLQPSLRSITLDRTDAILPMFWLYAWVVSLFVLSTKTFLEPKKILLHLSVIFLVRFQYFSRSFLVVNFGGQLWWSYFGGHFWWSILRWIFVAICCGQISNFWWPWLTLEIWWWC